MNAIATMTTADLEQVYDRLAQAIDAAGDKSELMLVKLALLSAQRLGDPGVFEGLIETAGRDL